jgi:CO dehydrogenase nickel-insertion accessory protein CooC1
VLGQLESGTRAVIADMEAGLGTLTRMPENSLDRALLIANPDLKSIEVVRRAMEIIAERKITPHTLVVANRVRSQSDLGGVRAALNGTEVVVVPEDPEIRRADFEGQAPIDSAQDSPAVQALLGLARSWPERHA